MSKAFRRTSYLCTLLILALIFVCAAAGCIRNAGSASAHTAPAAVSSADEASAHAASGAASLPTDPSTGAPASREGYRDCDGVALDLPGDRSGYDPVELFIHEPATPPEDEPGADDEPGGDTDADAGGDAVSAPYPDPDKPMIALTFDDGPTWLVTDRLLDVIGDYSEENVHVTFFLSGYRLGSEDYPTLRRADELGCELGNHTYSHKELTSLSTQDVVWEVESVNDLIMEAVGKKAALLRTPYGSVNDTVRKAAPYPIISWNIDTNDWQGLDAQEIFDHVRETAADGAIILMHDLFSSTVDACKEIIPWLLENDYQLVTVSEMFAAKQLALETGLVYRSAASK